MIMHESQHNAYNSIDNVICYSIYPSTISEGLTSDIENNENDLIRICTFNENNYFRESY